MTILIYICHFNILLTRGR